MKTNNRPNNSIRRLVGFVSIVKFVLFCRDCKQPFTYGTPEMGDEYSLCSCDNKRVTCDDCGKAHLRKDMSINNMFLALCKLCNGGTIVTSHQKSRGMFKSPAPYWKVLSRNSVLYVITFKNSIDPWFDYAIVSINPDHYNPDHWIEFPVIEIIEQHDSLPNNYARRQAIAKAKQLCLEGDHDPFGEMMARAYDNEPSYDCLCRGANHCIQCNPKLFI